MNLYCIAGRFCGTQQEARALCREAELPFVAEIYAVDVPTDKAGLIDWLNAQRPTAPQFISQVSAEGEQPVERYLPTSYAQRSVELDADFEALPLAHQLHLAALALENARTHVGGRA